jgi:superfamily II DNA helicase RecQ
MMPRCKNYEHDKLEYFGSGKEQGENLWNSLMRQALLNNFLSKDIDQYGLLHLTKSRQFLYRQPLQHPFPVKPGKWALQTMMRQKTALNKAVVP